MGCKASSEIVKKDTPSTVEDEAHYDPLSTPVVEEKPGDIRREKLGRRSMDYDLFLKVLVQWLVAGINI